MPCFRSPSSGRETGVPVLADGAQSVGAVPDDGRRRRLPHDLGPEVALRPRRDRRPRRLGSGAARADLAELLLPARVRPGRLLRAAARRPALRGGLVVARHAAGDARRARASTRVVARARRGHGRAVPGAPARRGSSSSCRRRPRRSSRSGRTATRRALVARLHAEGVHVRDIPGRGLVRVSCGWWTSDEDLDRLVAALG